MALLTITYDPAQYKLVPREPNQAMCDAAYREYLDWFMHSSGDYANRSGYKRIYKAMLAAVPDTLPGVIEHSGEPVAEVISYTNGSYSRNYKLEWTRDVEAGAKLFTHPAPAQPAVQQDYPVDPKISADLERADWTPEQALRWYADAKHFDIVNGRTRILDTGAIASNALKVLSKEYAEYKGVSVQVDQPIERQELSDEEIEEIALVNGIKKSTEHWGIRYYTELGSNLFTAIRAIIAKDRGQG